MGLGGVILAGVGIVMVVLVANNRWSSTWEAMLGNVSAAPGSGGAAGSAQTQSYFTTSTTDNSGTIYT